MEVLIVRTILLNYGATFKLKKPIYKTDFIKMKIFVIFRNMLQINKSKY